MDNLVAPASPQAPITPAAAPDAAAPDDSQSTAPQLPPELTSVPAIQGLLAGAPPAFSARIKQFEKTDVAKSIIANKDALLAAGFAFYKSLHGDLAVMYNRFHIHGEDIKAADKAGKLQVLAPPFEQVDHALSKAGKNHPLLKNPQIPQGFASQSPQAAIQPGAQAAAGAPSTMDTPSAAPVAGQASGALQKRLQGARLTNMQAGAPTSGPAPGGGRLLNSILKQVV